MPPATPVTTPVLPATVAMLVLPLLHVPPVVASLSVIIAVWHTGVEAVIALTVGVVFTVITCVVVAEHKPLETV